MIGALALAALAGCGAASQSTSSAPPATAAGTVSRAAKRVGHKPAGVRRHQTKGRPDLGMTRCAAGKKVRYAGLGAPVAAFRAGNMQPPPNPAGTPHGLAW